MPNQSFTESQLNLITDNNNPSVNTFNIDNGFDYIRMAIFEDGVYSGREFFSNVPLANESDNFQITIYENTESQDIFVKPNDILDRNAVPSGNYLLQFDFLRNVFNNVNHSSGAVNGAIDLLGSYINPRFYIAEISPSRKEIRLYGRHDVNSSISFTEEFINNFETKIITEYAFDHVLGISNTRNLAVVNFQFDTISNVDNPSLVLRLNQPLPGNVQKLDECYIAKELFVSQTQTIIYVSDIQTTIVGHPLTPDNTFEHNNFNFNPDTFENKNQLLISASMSENTIQDILYKIQQKDKNLNIDYNNYKNHIFFGSAERKLKNFNKKVIEINDYLGELSASVASTGSHSGSYTVNRRKEIFGKLSDTYENFTPYEKFLYTDAQSKTTASAPGLGTNLAKSYAINKVIGTNGRNQITSSKLTNYDGFNTVYHVSTKANDDADEGIDGTRASIFSGQYLAEEPPFFNYSGSVYLSFLYKSEAPLHHENFNDSYDTEYNKSVKLPRAALATQSIQIGNSYTSSVISTRYDRYIFAASQSHWRATANTTGRSGSVNIPEVGDLSLITNFAADGIDVDLGYQILGQGFTTFPPTHPSSSYQQDSEGSFGQLLQPKLFEKDDQGIIYGNLDTSTPRSGSFVLPAGDLFAIEQTSSVNYTTLATSASFITDVKVTFNNPSSSLPFGTIYHTGSNEWKDWYSGSLASASTYDIDNIHSFTNNLPDYIQTDSTYDDLRLFLNMLGEKYDEIRNYIDNEKSFYSKSYKNYNETGSNQLTIPDNVLPMIAANMGWEFINPYTGSLENYFSIVADGGANIEEIKNETWRKVLNNLMYIYKSKGTLNSVNALLNTYGYPENALRIDEFGGSSEPMNPEILTNETKIMNDGLIRQAGNTHYVRKDSNPFYLFNFTGDKKLHLDWYTNNADGETIEFVFKSNNQSGSNQVLLESSGSGAEKATGSLFVNTNNPLDISGSTLIISSSDGTGITYTFDATASYNVSNTPTIGLLGITDSSSIAQRISESIGHSSGHNGKITTEYFQFLSASDGEAFYVSSSDRFAVTRTDGILSLIQTLSGSDGNKEILASSANISASGFDRGTDSQTLWDVRIMASASNSVSSSLEFRLNNSATASSDINIATNRISMSTDYLPLNNGKLWNVMLQRMTSSTDTSISQSYRLYAGLQSADKIKYFTTASMTVNGNSSFSASNANFVETGTLGIAPGSASSNISGNLVVGRTLTGSMAELRVWNQTLSASKFKQHILNKFSVVGNNLTSSIDNVAYRFRLNENYPSASMTSDIVDANPAGLASNPTNYTRDMNVVSGSYSITYITTFALSTRINVREQKNSNKILIDTPINFIRPLNPYKRSVQTIYDMKSAPARQNSSQVEIAKSVATRINEYTSEQFSDFDLTDFIGDPDTRYSSSYKALEDFKKKAHKGIKVDINKFIENNKGFFDTSLINSIEGMLPARVTTNNMGVIIENTTLDRNKHQYHKPVVENMPIYESNVFHMYYEKSGSLSGSHNKDLYIFNLSESEYIQPYTNKSPFYMYGFESGSKDNYLLQFSGSLYNALHEPIEPIHFGGDSGSYFHLTTGSEYIAPYKMKSPIYMYGKHNESGSRDNYLFDMSGSILSQPYKTMDEIHFGGTSGSYFNTITSSYFAQYNMGKPIYMYGKDSGSQDDYLFKFTGSLYNALHEPIEPIHFGGDSGSYFNILSGSYLSQYNMKKPLYMYGKSNSGSIDDYLFDFTGSEYTQPYNTIKNINISDSGSGIITITSSVHTPQSGSTRHIADRLGIINTDRRELNGEHYGSGKSYIWNAWGTGIDDVHFLHGTSSHGYYNQDFEFRLIGDIEVISSSVVNHSDGFSHRNLNYSNIHSFQNKIIVDTNKGFTHRAYKQSGSDVNSVDTSSFIDGRPMGRTHYFATSSDGNNTILYPPNHYIVVGTSKNSMGNNSDHMNSRGYVGSQHPVPTKFGILEGGRLVDPLHLTEATSSVDTNSVVGSSTDQAIVVISQGGRQSGGGG